MTATVTPIGTRGTLGASAKERDVENVFHQRTAPQPKAPPVAVLTSFVLSPGFVDAWIETWNGLARTATTWPGCRSFRLVRDRNDEMYAATLSEWDDLEAYSRFVRDSRIMWLGQALARMCLPTETRFLDVIPNTAPTIGA